MPPPLTKILEQHCAKVLSTYLPHKNASQNSLGKPPAVPLDILFRDYFAGHKSLGPKQRKLISDRVHTALRYNTLLDYLLKGNLSDCTERLRLLNSSDFYGAMDNDKLPNHIRCSYPKLLYKKIEESLGDESVAFNVCKVMNTRASLTLRINPTKTTRARMLAMIRNYLKWQALQTQYSPYGIKVIARQGSENGSPSLHETTEFKEGHFEIQDQGSQLAALSTNCQQGDLVLDYCGGSGGKSLAIAHFLQNKGQIFLHDIREKPLQNAKRRFNKAGFENVQFHCGEDKLQKIRGKVDWIIVDVPCTGTGTIRRNPDIKLRFNQNWLKQNLILQQQIVQRAIKYMKKDGKLVYMTCSILKDENQEQIRKVTKNFGLKVHKGQILKIVPEKDGMDGFFSAVLERE